MVFDAADKSKIYKQLLIEDALTNNIVMKTVVFFHRSEVNVYRLTGFSRS